MNAAFARLGTAPTRDIKTIKRAYAVALKAIDQATEREAFERLRLAYEQALAWAARDENTDDADAEGDEGEDSEQEDDHGDQRAPNTALPAEPPAFPTPITLAPDEARQALRHWTEQLRDSPPASAAAVLEAALADPRLLHLDSHAQLEARIADLLHSDPIGRAALFDTAAARFHWTDRNARPFASTGAAHWIARVVNQGLQWQGQKPSAIDLQRKALDTVTQVASPDAEQTRRFAEVLADMAGDFPDWFALHLSTQGHANLPAWQAINAKLAPHWARQIERKERYFGTRKKTMGTLIGAVFVLLLVTAVLSGVMNRMLANHAAPAVAAAGVGAPTVVPEPVLAYEFTGAVTHDSCESTEEFVHESNWLEVDDSDAVALLATRAMRCQDKGLWLRKADALMTCLRAERAVALGAGRPEELLRCLPPKAGSS